MKTMICLALCLTLCLGLVPMVSAGAVTNWYEVFVYSYADSDGDGIGDFVGLMGKLDYIKNLGFNGLWLMPVMPSPSYHKYDVTDYLAVDAQYGNLQDFKNLVAACHERGIRIIIDLPLNHSSTKHPWFERAAEAIKAGRLNDPALAYYHFSQEAGKGFAQLAGTNWYYEEQFAGGNMPDLNLDNPDLREEIKRILAFWLLECGVDGFRLDAVTSFYTDAEDKNIEFLRFLKQTAQGIKKDSYIVGECWKGLEQIASYYQSGVDSFFLFPASQAEGYVASALRSRQPAKAFTDNLQKVQKALPDMLLAPFLSNHDTGRTVGLVQGRQAPERLKFAHALIALMGGDTFTYYGEEIGMAGSGPDPNKRLGMLWQEGQSTNPPPGVTKIEYPYPSVKEQLADANSLLNYIKHLNYIKLELPAISLGQLEVVETTADTCLLKRTTANGALLIAVNFSGKEARVQALGMPCTLLAVLDAGAAATNPGKGQTVQLAPYGIAFLQPEAGK